MDICHAKTGGRSAEHLEEAIGGERRPALAHKYMAQSGRLIPEQLAQCADFDTGQWLDAIVAALPPDHLQPARIQIDLVPTQRHEFASHGDKPLISLWRPVARSGASHNRSTSVSV